MSSLARLTQQRPPLPLRLQAGPSFQCQLPFRPRPDLFQVTLFAASRAPAPATRLRIESLPRVSRRGLMRFETGRPADGPMPSRLHSQRQMESQDLSTEAAENLP